MTTHRDEERGTVKTIEYQIMIERPLTDVMATLSQKVQLWQPGQPAGGYRFEGLDGRTRVTIIGRAEDALDRLAVSLGKVVAATN
jgi:hypothetical protein